MTMCAEGKDMLVPVLNEFEGLVQVDGAPSRMDSFNDVFELKPKSIDFSGLTNYFFKLMKEGAIKQYFNKTIFYFYGKSTYI